jgi:hypothetical protein
VVASAAPAVPVASSYGDSLYQTTLSELRADLGALSASSNNRDLSSELQGLHQEAPREYQEAAAAARLSQDPAQRDLARLGIRRLNERAFELRKLGYRSGQSFFDYRRAATTLDAAADVVRVLIGEALVDVGLGSNGWLLVAPASDVLERGKALIAALEALSGSDECCHDNEQGENLAEYRLLLAAVPPSLRSYVRPQGLSRLVDKLINLVSSAASSATGEGLRQLAFLAPLEIGHLRQLRTSAASVVPGIVPGQPAPLRIFVRALDLFLQSFVQRRSGELYIELALPVTVSARKLSTARAGLRAAFRTLLQARARWALNTESLVANDWYQGGRLARVATRDNKLLAQHSLIDFLAG